MILEERNFLISLISELLGDRKNWYEGLRQNWVTKEEVSLGLVSHIYTVKDGYFTKGEKINFENLHSIEQILQIIS